MTQQRKSAEKAATLVELVVTLVILSILFAIAVPSLLQGYIHLSQFEKNESYAKTMYLSARIRADPTFVPAVNGVVLQQGEEGRRAESVV